MNYLTNIIEEFLKPYKRIKNKVNNVFLLKIKESHYFGIFYLYLFFIL